jgi:hypothetical protein
MQPLNVAWADYALYLPAIQEYFARLNANAFSGAGLPGSLSWSQLDILSEAGLYQLPEALYSAGIVMQGNASLLTADRDDMVTRRKRGQGASRITGDNGGFQLIKPNSGFDLDGPTTRLVLRWLERHCDVAIGPDVPSAAIHTAGNRYFGQPRARSDHSGSYPVAVK